MVIEPKTDPPPESNNQVARKSPPDTPKLSVAHIQITDHIVMGVLAGLIRRGRITPESFQLSLSRQPGWNELRTALSEGAVDAACVLAPIAMELFRSGVPIRLVLLTHKGGSIFVRNRLAGDGRPSKEYYRGKTFFIPHEFSIHHMLAHRYFTEMGLKVGDAGDPEIDVGLEVVSPIRMPGYLEANPDASGYMVAEPLGTKAVAEGVAETEFISGELWADHPCCVLAVRESVLRDYSHALFELTDLMVQTGRLISGMPEMASRLGVEFLDPDGRLGLETPMVKAVLTKPNGLKTNDLIPDPEAFERIQHYMYYEMGVGGLIDLNRFIDIRYAEAASREP
jgi:ABC-type nitrate/sulfonate/bicarbonate transport system substrate-binding protein